MKVYRVMRREDVSGVSGTGHVADLVEFDDGSAVVRWRPVPLGSTVVYASVADAVAIHGHDGRTVLEQEWERGGWGVGCDPGCSTNDDPPGSCDCYFR